MTASAHVYQAWLEFDPDDVPLSLVRGTISLDSSRMEHVTAELTITMPGAWEYVGADAGLGYGDAPYGDLGYGGVIGVPIFTVDEAALSALDPRENRRIRIEVDATFPGAAAQSRTFNLGLRQRSAVQATGEVELRLASDEALLNDYAPLADDAFPLTLVASVRDIVEYVLDESLGATLAVSPATDADVTPTGDASDDAFTWQAGQSGIDFLRPILQSRGLRLVCDESRVWTLRDENYAAGGSITVRYGVNMVEGFDTVSRDEFDWFDAAVTVHEWPDGDGVVQKRVDGYALTTPWTKMVRFERDTPYPGPGFSEYAVRRAQGRGREITVTAVSDWRAQCEQVFQVDFQDIENLVGAAHAVTFDLGPGDTGDRMTLTARIVEAGDHAYIVGDVGISYLDVPVDISYLDFDWTDV